MRIRLTWIALLGMVLSAQTPDWRNGIVQVEAAGKSPGTGFVVALQSDRAYIVTCAHVVEGDASPSVTFNADPERRRFPSAVRNPDRRTDLVVLVVEKPPANSRVVMPLLNSSVSEGADALIAGYPGETGARFTVLRGAIASVSGTELSISPAAEEGFSGGPVLADGRVIGVVFEHTKTFGRAIPVAIVDLYLRGLGVRWGGEAPKREERKAVLETPSAPVAGAIRENSKDGLKYVWIPPGKFTMGCSPRDQECDADEKRARKVTISQGFWLGQTEVTQAAYQRVTGANPSKFKGTQRPVEQVTWNEAGDYCGKVGLRLPTEAEWEYAARAGNPNARYGDLESIAWYGANSGSQTHDVAQKQANAWGLYDMLGNVWEWTADLYPNTTQRILRGGSWLGIPRFVRVSDRNWVGPTVSNWYGPTNRYDYIGFRCAGELR